jgi:nucleoside-diphosphate-sugar epimerase
MKVLVIGGTQFVGRHTVEVLLEHGHEVTVVNRGVTPDPLPAEVQRLRADRTNPDELRGAVSGHEFDAVVDCIAYTVEDVETAYELFRGRIERYVFISTQAVYATSELFPIDESMPLIDGTSFAYAQQKADIERWLDGIGRSEEFPWVSLRPGYVYGPYNNVPVAEFALFARIDRDRPIIIPGDGSFPSHHTHGRDLADAVLASLGRDEAIGRAYNIVGEYAQTANRLVRAAGEAAGREPQIVRWRDATNAEARRIFFYLVRPVLLFTIERAKRELDWRPQFDIERGMADSYRWYRESGYAERDEPDFSLDDEVLASLAT